MLDVFPPYADHPVRVAFFGDEIESVSEVDHLTGEVLTVFDELPVWPATHYVTERRKLETAVETIREELRVRLAELKADGKLLEAQRLEMRVNYDLEMLETMGFTSGIENYSRHLDGRSAGEPANTLIDYFGERLPDAHRRVARHDSADSRHARRRPEPQDHAGRARFSAPERAGQPAAAGSTSSRSGYRSSSTCRRRRATTSCASRSRSSSRSSARPASSTRRS